jgi:hypothetical protein
LAAVNCRERNTSGGTIGCIHEVADDERPDGRRGAGERRPRADRAGAVIGHEAGLQDRQAPRREHSTTHPLQRAGQDQEGCVRGDATEGRGEREPDDPDDEHLPAPEAVTEAPAHEDERGQREQVCGEDPLEGRDARVEVLANRGQGQVHDRGVEARYGGAEDGGEQHPPPARPGEAQAFLGHGPTFCTRGAWATRPRGPAARAFVAV